MYVLYTLDRMKYIIFRNKAQNRKAFVSWRMTALIEFFTQAINNAIKAIFFISQINT